LFGAGVTGFGYSLVYPGFGVEAVRRAPPESRGLAMGAYTAFLDLALGLANPALGLVAGKVGLGAVFLVSALVVTCSAVVAARLLTAGIGWVQQEGVEKQVIKPGDVVWTPPGVKHWHGATATTAVTHIAIQEFLNGKNVE
jgi:MFS family permease